MTPAEKRDRDWRDMVRKAQRVAQLYEEDPEAFARVEQLLGDEQLRADWREVVEIARRMARGSRRVDRGA